MQRFSALNFLEDSEPADAATNMAIDEALLESVTAPTIRFYGWRGPAVSFGYFGEYSDVSHLADEREIVRRWTGGGIVPHGEDLTYSIILPVREDEPFPPSRLIYTQVHEAIRSALGRSLPAELAGTDAPKISAACFANPVRADVLLAGRKIAGAAQRRTRRGLLHQGSIQEVVLPADFRLVFADALAERVTCQEFTPDLQPRARHLAETKYGTREWLQRR